MDDPPRHAIIFGASGLIGWAVVEQLLRSYPETGTFSKITAVTNREVKLSESYWPAPDANQPTLQLVSGIDLRRGDGIMLADTLRREVEDVHTVTHVFYLVFTSLPDGIEEVATNRQMLQNVVDAHNLMSRNLQFVVFPGGTRGYGIYAPGGVFTSLLTEDMVDNLPPEEAKTVVYPAYREVLRTASKGRAWTWCEVCPDAIIGFTPNGSQFSLALHWAQYLSLYAHNHGVGPSISIQSDETPAMVEVPFPGNAAGAKSLFSPVSAPTLARFMIYASLHPDVCGDGRLFNVADREAPATYGEIWSRIASWFGLVGVGPTESIREEVNALKVGELPEGSGQLTPGEYVAKHQGVFSECGRENAVRKGVGVGSRQLDSVGYWLTFDRQLSLERLKNTGFEEVVGDPVQGWLDSFEMFRKAGLIL
ncbi:hypothetical protein F4777DRAFT_591148 [Nemania sp. FL0916]|nr:hypothetical protein F4777DRAFT_591148 [Nemania sp. FL0916]